jgi:hypothetical protein
MILRFYAFRLFGSHPTYRTLYEVSPPNQEGAEREIT